MEQNNAAVLSQNLRPQARIDFKTAESLALSQQPGAVVNAVPKRNRNGVLFYSFDIRSADGMGLVLVNSMTGEVLRTRQAPPVVAQLQSRRRSKMDRREWRNH